MANAILISQEAGAPSPSCYTSSSSLNFKGSAVTARLQYSSQNTDLTQIVAIFRSARNDIPSSLDLMRRLSHNKSTIAPASSRIVTLSRESKGRKQKKKKRAQGPLIPKPRVKKSHRGFTSHHFKNFDTKIESGGVTSDDSRGDLYEQHSFRSSENRGSLIPPRRALATYRAKGVLQD